MKYFRLSALILFVLCAFLSCKKKEELIIISGRIVDAGQGINLQDVLVELSANKIESGIFSAHFDSYGSERTNADGEFSFELENLTYGSVKLSFRMENYYSWEYEIDGDVIKNDYFHDETYQLQAKSWIQFFIKNKKPVDSQDYFDLRILNGLTSCETCCTGEIFKFFGTDVDEVILCQMVGHESVSVRWNSRKASEQTGDTELVFLPSFDTTRVEFTY